MKRTLVLLTACAILLGGCGSGNNGSGKQSAATSEPAAASESKEPDAMKFKAEQIGQALLDGQYDAIYKQTSAEFQKQIAKDQFREVVTSVSEGVKVWKPHSQARLNGTNYFTWTDQEGKKGVILTMDAENVITGLQFKPLESFPATDDTLTKLEYGAPFKGEWFVFWGGRDVLSNYHYAYPSQRYAYDIIQVKDGYSYKGDAAKNESYYAFGQEVLAPRNGKVVDVVNDIKDNVPVGTMNADRPAGNMVVIDHGDGEYSFLAHLREGSVKVKIGDKVAKGDPVGLCGNSGNSSEPHLHYQVSDNKDLFAGKSIPVRWENGLVMRQGEAVANAAAAQ